MVALVVGAGGAFGAIARYYVTDWVRSAAGAEMPWGTLVVNVAGSFVFGFLFVWLQSRAASTFARELLLIGFLGSFTTFSTFSYETVALARTGELVRAGGYAVGSLALGVVGVLLGAGLAALVAGPRG
jgi:CrcB protein